MDGKVKMDLDKLPIKRVNVVDEFGNEHFSPEKGFEEERVDKIRRIDFTWVLEKDDEKQKSSKDSPAQISWPWKGLVENLHVAREELSIILDLISRVEANDAVTVAGMQKPKQLPSETLVDVSVSAATKLQKLRQLSRYFKQSANALDKQVERESRFYGSLIRLQQNWKVKRLRPGVTVPGNEGFMIDLQDGPFSELTALSRSSSYSSIRIENGVSGFLTVQLPQKSFRSLCLAFGISQSSVDAEVRRKQKMSNYCEPPLQVVKNELITAEEANECVKYSHSVLRKFQRSIFEEQVFDMVSRATYDPSVGVNVIGMREDFLQLGINQESYLYLCLASFEKEEGRKMEVSCRPVQDKGVYSSNSDSALVITRDELNFGKLLGLQHPLAFEIYLLDLFHTNSVIRARDKRSLANTQQVSVIHSNEWNELLGHFCLTVTHRFFSRKVLLELESLVSRVSYLRLLSHPTWHSRLSSWSISLKLPNSIICSGRRSKLLDSHDMMRGDRLQFNTKVVLNDNQITICGEGAPSITSSHTDLSRNSCVINCFGCELEDLSMILLQQVASQVIRWLHEEVVIVGIKVRRDFLSLYFVLKQGETVGLVAHVDPDDLNGCISWWMVMEDGSMDSSKLSSGDNESMNKSFLGYPSLEELYSIFLDLVELCSIGGTMI